MINRNEVDEVKASSLDVPLAERLMSSRLIATLIVMRANCIAPLRGASLDAVLLIIYIAILPHLRLAFVAPIRVAAWY